MAQLRSAVVAGSKGFVDAVQGHIKLRFGSAPRVARDPAEALLACADSGLLVLEYAGSPWLEAVKSLRGSRGEAGLSIVAAVPAGQASDVQPLQRAGVDEVVSWQGRVDPVMWAVDRIVGRQSAKESAAAPTAPEAAGEVDAETGFEIREVPGADAPAPREARPSPSAPVPTPAPVLPRAVANPTPTALAVPWPEAVPSSAAAEALLLAASAGQPTGDDAQHAAAERVLAAASELERAAFAGAEVPVEPAVLRAAAAMRLRLELALSTVPANGDAVNQPAAQQLLAEVDGVLEQLKVLAASAPAGVAPSLEPVRLAVVDGGVKLAGALSQLVNEPVVPPVAAPPKAAAVRVLSNEREESLGHHQPKALWVVLGIVIALAVSYHSWVRFARPIMPPRTVANAPSNTIGMVRGDGKVVIALAGKPIDPAEVERFKAAEQAKGNVVTEISPGTWIVVPESEARARATGGKP